MREEAIIPIAQFLSRAWSERELKIVISNISIPSTTTDTISMPMPNTFPASDQVTRYRLWRASLWHEAMHHYCGTFVRTWECDNYGGTFHFILNAVEDYLIEALGVEIYPGMAKEIDLSKAIYFSNALPPTDIVEEFAQLLLFDAVKATPVDSAKRAVDFVKTEIRKGNYDTIAITNEVARILNVNANKCYKRYQSPKGYAKKSKLKKRELEEAIKEWLKFKKKVSEETDKLSGDKEENKEEIKEEGEKIRSNGKKDSEKKSSEVEDLLSPSKEIVEEFKRIKESDRKIEQKRQEGAVEVQAESKVMRIVVPSTKEDERDYYDENLIARLKSEMRKIRKGWKEVCDDSGEFDVESYVSRHKKCFIDEQRLRVGGYKVLILLDHSGSIRWFQDRYKKACIALCEALATLGVPFAVYTFTELHKYNTLFMVKGFSEKWSKMNAKRLVSIEAQGSTPLAESYVALEPIVKKTKNLIFFTLTDGEPNSYTYTQAMVKSLRKHCKMVALGIGVSIEQVTMLTRNLEGLEYDRCVALDDIRKIPNKILSLLGEDM